MSLATPLRRTAATMTTMVPRTTTPTASTAASTTTSTTKTTYVCTQCRHATLLRRPQRPYTFTQLVTLSDGSTYTQRTTSPTPVYRSTRDTRNSLMWNPSSSKLMNVEEDEAGRLAAFRARFGRSWDANTPSEEEGLRRDEKDGLAGAAASEAAEKIQSGKGDSAAATAGGTASQEEAKARAEKLQQQLREEEEEEDNLLDLISSFGQEEQDSGKKK